MSPQFFTHNRNVISQSTPGSLIVITAYSAMQRRNDASFMFEQEANFLWLTGIEAPDWQLIIDGDSNKSWLVSPSISEVHQIFDGSLSVERARSISGVDGVLSEADATEMLRDLSKKHKVVYSLGDAQGSEHYDFTVNPAPKKVWHNLELIFDEVKDCRREVAKHRAIKQPEEIAASKKAITLTVLAFEEVKKKLASLEYEYEAEAEFTYIFGKNGADGHAYDPIVAAGKNACTLHYVANDSALPQKGLILMDVGAAVDGYAADITRTYALGTPTDRQRAVHKAVETAHYKIIDLIKPGVSLKEYQNTADEIMKDALGEVGLLADRNNHDTYRKYFPHAISHGLGIDVHESLGGYKEFQPGMILTVEPGIYIPEEGIGIRIEDDILVTETGNENLSKDLPTSL